MSTALALPKIRRKDVPEGHVAVRVLHGQVLSLFRAADRNADGV